MVEFHHRWWHRASLWLTIFLSAAAGSICSYAALFAPPEQKGQWIPLIAIILCSWSAFAYFVGALGILAISYQATDNGIQVMSSEGVKIIFLPWSQVTEVHKGSNLTGLGYIRSRAIATPFRFMNLVGEANAFVEFSIRRCVETNPALGV